jgi:outer membrane protein assembly factor BamD
MMGSMTFRVVLITLLALPVGGCSGGLNFWPFGGSSDSSDTADIPEDPASVPVEVLYNRGVDSMNAKKYTEASTQFDLVEQNYPYSTWAVNAQLMQGYAQYLLEHYTDAIGTLNRFIQLHPSHRDVAYAYYLRALSYYEQISDIQRDQKATQQAIGAFQEVINRFPDSAYARDAKLKVDLCRDHLAGKEMEIGRFYERQHLYTAAVNRFQRVVDDYQTTNHVAEALHRLTEIYLKLGLVNEARRTASVLGYNYPGNSWYEKSYDDLLATDSLNAPLPATAAAGVPATAADGVPATAAGGVPATAAGGVAGKAVPGAQAAGFPAGPPGTAASDSPAPESTAPQGFFSKLWNSVF